MAAKVAASAINQKMNFQKWFEIYFLFDYNMRTSRFNSPNNSGVTVCIYMSSYIVNSKVKATAKATKSHPATLHTICTI